MYLYQLLLPPRSFFTPQSFSVRSQNAWQSLLLTLCLSACTLSESVPSGSDAAFEPVPVWKFCHGLREGLETAVIKGYQSSCEEGPIEIGMTPEEIEDIRDIAINGVITGKANDMSVTGGTWFY